MKPTELLNNEQFVSELLANELSVRELSKKWGLSKSAVGKWRKRLLEKDGLPTSSKVSELKEQHRETWVGNEGEISVVIHEEITHENILKKFGHDPEQVEIVGVLEQTHWMIDGDPTRYNHRYKFKVRQVEVIGSQLGRRGVDVLDHVASVNHHDFSWAEFFGKFSGPCE